jgi:hypothetical protein
MEIDPQDIDRRIEAQLDKLDNQYITQADIEKVEKKVKILKAMKQ